MVDNTLCNGVEFDTFNSFSYLGAPIIANEKIRKVFTTSKSGISKKNSVIACIKVGRFGNVYTITATG